MRTSHFTAVKDSGHTLVEVLVVIVILSILSGIVIYTAASARQIGLTTQSTSGAQQTARMVMTIMERDLRLAGSGIYANTYRENNGGEVGELTGSDLPNTYNYHIGQEASEGFMIPPVEVVNGTDDQPSSYLNPLYETIGLTNEYREPGTDMITVYSAGNSAFSGYIEEIQGLGQEHISIYDPVKGAQLMDVWEAMGGEPIVIFVIDDQGEYATLRTITDVKLTGHEYQLKMTPSFEFNQPANFKMFLENLDPEKYDFAGDPDSFRRTVTNDWFGQIAATTYFIYSHPDPSLQAQGWLVRLDLAALMSAGMNIDANDPDTVRPYVLAEHVSDLQAAYSIYDETTDTVSWYNDETLEDYTHSAAGEDSVSDEYLDLVNNLRAIRYSIVAYTDQSSVDDPLGFPEKNSMAYYDNFSTVEAVASMIGITPQLEDRVWTQYELADRLWYRRATQLTSVAKIRNLDLENTFARVQ